MDYYTQKVEIEFADARAARSATVEILPLYKGYEWAISSRWDDNVLTDPKMRDVLERHGYKATWYLIATEGGGYYGPDYGYFKGGQPYSGMGARLLSGGNSIGGHSLTHPHMAYLNRNRIFEEIMGIRMDRESSSGRPVISYAFSFCNFRNEAEGDAVQEDIAEILRRSGYYHIVNHWFNTSWEHPEGRAPFLESALLPSDGKDIDEAFGRYLADESRRRDNPNISFNMHVWYTTEKAWAKFEKQLDQYGRNPRWWYCNQSEYAAYRYQFLHSSLTQRIDSKDKRKLSVTLRRPELLDLNDPIPLTFAVRGIATNTVRRVQCESADTDMVSPAGGEFWFHLSHDRNMKLPKTIASYQNHDNHDSLQETDTHDSFPFITASLHMRRKSLEFFLRNESGQPITNIRLVYRLPLAWRRGVMKKQLGTLNGGAERRDRVRLTPRERDYKCHAGTSVYVVQMDFVHAGSPGRLYVSCRVERNKKDSSYAQNGFQMLGPIPSDRVDVEAHAARIAASPVKNRRCDFGDGISREWRRVGQEDYAFLNVDMIYTTGRNRPAKGQYFIMLTSLHSPKAQRVRPVYEKPFLRSIYLNGKQVQGDIMKLSRGKNDLILVYYSGESKFSGSHYGAYFQLVNPKSGRRINSVRYQPERVAFK